MYTAPLEVHPGVPRRETMVRLVEWKKTKPQASTCFCWIFIWGMFRDGQGWLGMVRGVMDGYVGKRRE